MRAMQIVMAALIATLAVEGGAEARTHKPRIHVSRPHKARAPRSTYKTVRIRRADGTEMTGYRDSFGTHLHRSDGSTINCTRRVTAANVDVSCR